MTEHAVVLLGFLVAFMTLGLGTTIVLGVTIAVSSHPDRVIYAKTVFAAGALCSLLSAYLFWLITPSRDPATRISVEAIWLAATVVGLIAGFRFANRSLTDETKPKPRGEIAPPSLTSPLPSADPLDAVRLAEVRSEWGKLTTEQQRLLARILVSGGLSWNQIDASYWKRLPVYQELLLSDYLLERSTLLEHRSKGNADLRRYIQSRKEGKTDFTLGLRTWKVKAEFIDTLRQVVAEPVAAPTEAQRNVEARLQPERPELDITFDKAAPEFVDPTKVVENGVTWPCKLYRVTVTSHSSSPVTRLLAKGVKNTTEERTYPPLHLRITGKNDSQKEIRLHKGEPQFWDVVEKKDAEQDWVRLMETDIPAGHILQVPGEFLITASCDDGLNVTKRVVLGSKENGDLDFRLADP